VTRYLYLFNHFGLTAVSSDREKLIYLVYLTLFLIAQESRIYSYRLCLYVGLG